MLIKTILNKIHRFKSFVYTNVCSSWEGDDLIKDIFSIGIDEIKYKIGHKYLTLGPVEGLNNKAKVAIRKSYGFREYDVLKMALSRYPLYSSTHKM